MPDASPFPQRTVRLQTRINLIERRYRILESATFCTLPSCTGFVERPGPEPAAEVPPDCSGMIQGQVEQKPLSDASGLEVGR